MTNNRITLRSRIAFLFWALFTITTFTDVLAATPSASSIKPLIYLSTQPTAIHGLPVWVALASGYFEEQGLDVKVVTGTGGLLGISMLLSGEGQIGGLGDTAIRAAFQGSPMKILAFPVKGPNFYLYSRPEFADIPSLKGKTIATGSLVGSPQIIAMKILHDYYGWKDPSRDVRWISLREQRVQAVQSGAVQGAMLLSPENVQADKIGLRQLFKSTDYIAIPSPAGVTVTVDYYKRNQPDIRRFLRAHLKGLKRVHSDPSFAVSVIQQRLRLDAGTAKAIYDTQLSTFTTDDTVPEKALRLALDFNKEQIKTVARDLKISDLFDFTLINELNTELKTNNLKQ